MPITPDEAENFYNSIFQNKLDKLTDKIDTILSTEFNKCAIKVFNSQLPKHSPKMRTLIVNLYTNKGWFVEYLEVIPSSFSGFKFSIKPKSHSPEPYAGC